MSDNDLTDQQKFALQTEPSVRRLVQLRWTDSAGNHVKTVDRRMTVGSAPRVDVSVNDRLVSRLHAEVDPHPDGLWVRDLGSLNGTYVQGVFVREARLPDRGEIRVGGTRIASEPTTSEVELWPSDRFGGLVGGSDAMRELFVSLARTPSSSGLSGVSPPRKCPMSLSRSSGRSRSGGTVTGRTARALRTCPGRRLRDGRPRLRLRHTTSSRARARHRGPSRARRSCGAHGRCLATLACATSGCWIVAGLEDRPVADGAADGAIVDGPTDASNEVSNDASNDAPIDALTDAGARCPATNAFGGLERRSDLSTAQDELGITLTPDELTAYVGSGQLSVPSSSLFVTTRIAVSALFPAARKLEGQGTGIASGPNISAGGDELFFARAFADGGTRTAFDLFVGVPDMDAASPGLQGVQPLAALNAPDARADDQDPFFMADRKAVYFSSDRDGFSRIYRSARTGGTFAAPTLVLKTLTTGAELSPKVTADELTLYFAGNPPGMPLAFQIYMATRNDTSADFGTPTKVTALAEGASLDFPGWLSPDGCTIYFLSNRAGGSGGFDVYRAVKQR